MKILRVNILLAICGAWLLVSNAQPQEARVVRARLNTNSLQWTICINQNGGSNLINNASFTNEFSRLSLHHGDIVIFEHIKIGESLQPKETWDWFRSHLKSNNFAWYYNLQIPTNEFFSRAIYHWVAPYEEPRLLTNSYFYYQSELLGHGMSGYVAMLDDISKRRLEKILILGSNFRGEASFTADDRPYQDYRNMLKQTLQKSGTTALELSPSR